MRSADRDRGVEGDDETTNILDALDNSWIAILHRVRIILEDGNAEWNSPWPKRSLVAG